MNELRISLLTFGAKLITDKEQWNFLINGEQGRIKVIFKRLREQVHTFPRETLAY